MTDTLRATEISTITLGQMPQKHSQALTQDPLSPPQKPKFLCLLCSCGWSSLTNQLLAATCYKLLRFCSWFAASAIYPHSWLQPLASQQNTSL